MMDDVKMVMVEFLPDRLLARVPKGSVLTDAMVKAGVLLPLDCGGKGTCGRCLVKPEGPVSEPDPPEFRHLDPRKLKEGLRLACQTRALGDVTVTIPGTLEHAESSWAMDIHDETLELIGTPVIVGHPLTLPHPGLDDTRSDLSRLLNAIPQSPLGPVFADYKTAARVSSLARAGQWRVNAYLRGNEVVGVDRLNTSPLGLAVDLGSTKLAAYLMDLSSGKVLAAKGRLNPQIAFGADVITRLQRAVANEEDFTRQTTLVREALAHLAQDLAESRGVDVTRIIEMCLVGNSVMTHLLLGLPLAQLGAPPFVSSMDQSAHIKARELGITLSPGAYVYLPPLIGGYVGSDNVAMILGTDLDQPGPCRLGLDIGTNTEVVLTVPGKSLSMFIASAPSGPTFEGAHLSSGMRAMGGAISEVETDGTSLSCKTIDGRTPAGICGSGIIDALAVLLELGIMNSKGHLNRTHERVTTDNGTIRFMLVPGPRSATGHDISITQSDISQVQLAKAAINAAGQTLLALAGLDESHIGEVILAGSFGSHITMDHARRIGLVPNIPTATYTQVGNAAGKGARMLLNNREQRRRARDVTENCRYVELTREKMFNSLFARGLAFPER